MFTHMQTTKIHDKLYNKALIIAYICSPLHVSTGHALCVCLCVWAHINNSISLDVVHVWVHDAELLAVSLGGADDTGGDSVLQSEGAANCHHKLPWPQISWLGQSQHRKLLLLRYEHTYIQSELSTTHTWGNTDMQRKKIGYKWWMTSEERQTERKSRRL